MTKIQNEKLKREGYECISCEKTFPLEMLHYCPCEETYICKDCCKKCEYNEKGTCEWDE